MTRVLTAAIGIPIVVGVTYFGGIVFVGVIAVAAIVAQLEFYDLQRKIGWKPSSVLGIVLSLVIILRYEISWNEPVLILVVLAILADLLRSGPENNPLSRLAGTIMGAVYPVWLFSYFTSIRLGLDATLSAVDAFGMTMMLMILVWVSDSSAYFVGRSFGQTPLAPTLSPKKTWEGSLAAVPSAIIAALIFKLLWLSFLSWTDVIALALIAGAWGQVGDLAESALKRSAGVKDSGSILPGHGGMLDRLDSLIVVVPLYYLYLRYFMDIL